MQTKRKKLTECVTQKFPFLTKNRAEKPSVEGWKISQTLFQFRRIRGFDKFKKSKMRRILSWSIPLEIFFGKNVFSHKMGIILIEFGRQKNWSRSNFILPQSIVVNCNEWDFFVTTIMPNLYPLIRPIKCFFCEELGGKMGGFMLQQGDFTQFFFHVL